MTWWQWYLAFCAYIALGEVTLRLIARRYKRELAAMSATLHLMQFAFEHKRLRDFTGVLLLITTWPAGMVLAALHMRKEMIEEITTKLTGSDA